MTAPTAPSGVTASTGQQEQHRPDKSTSSNSTPQDTKQALIIRCPRCDSSNTKFCYYNNYNLSQPRHFCKTCRRYWTQGGALRNVPVGGGCRKNKKLKSCNSSIPTSSEISSSSGYRFFPSAMDFQIGGGGTPLYGHNHPFGLVDPSAANTTFASPIVFGANPNHRFGVEPSALTMGFNNFTSNQEVGIGNFVHQSSLTSSIESLSCINQDMHWKLQQQRLSVLFAADMETQKHGKVSLHSQMQETQPMEMYSSSSASASKGKESGMNNGDMVTEWLYVNSGSSIIPANSKGDDLGKGGNPATSNWSNGVQATWGL